MKSFIKNKIQAMICDGLITAKRCFYEKYECFTRVNKSEKHSCLRIIFLFLLLPFFSISSSLRAEEALLNDSKIPATSWDAYVFPFRAGHHISFSTGVANSRWKIEDKEYPAQNFFFKFQYLFHIQALKNLGYAVGSSIGYMNDRHSYQDDFSTSGSYHLPGLVVAGVYNVSPRFRLIGGYDIYLEQMNHLQVNFKKNIHRADVTMLSFGDFFISLDWFYSLSWAVHGEFHRRDAFLHSPFASKDSVLGLKFEKQDYWLGLGVTYHFL